MNNINTIINDIKDLRDKEVTVFGTKIGEPSPYEIDVIDVLFANAEAAIAITFFPPICAGILTIVLFPV